MNNEYKLNGYSLARNVMRYLSRNSEVVQSGHGNITITCSSFWEMDDLKFCKTFGIKKKEVVGDE